MRTAVQFVAVASLLALASGLAACTSDQSQNDCYNDVERSYTVNLPSPDPAIDYAAGSCRLDEGACPKLCAAILMRQQILNVLPGSCDVRFTSSEAKVDIGYQVSKNTCFFVDNPAGGSTL